jgi:hypothetical protein
LESYENLASFCGFKCPVCMVRITMDAIVFDTFLQEFLITLPESVIVLDYTKNGYFSFDFQKQPNYDDIQLDSESI